jgi:hypothetical protein
VQWGGERLCEVTTAEGNLATKLPTDDGRARFSVIEVAQRGSSNKLKLSTRRGKQFNADRRTAR